MVVKLVTLPFTTFGSIGDASWNAEVHCPSCHRRVQLGNTDSLRPRLAFHARFRCTGSRYNGLVCGSLGHLRIRPPERIPANSTIQHFELLCGDPPAWSIVEIQPGVAPWPALQEHQRFACPVCRLAAQRTWHGGSASPFSDGYVSVGGGRPAF